MSLAQHFALRRWRNTPAMVKTALYTLGLAPAVWFFALAVQDRLGADPVRALEHVLGLWALRFLIVGLLVSPVRAVTGWRLLPYRRALGLLAFYYAVLHFSVWLILDESLDLDLAWADVLKRPYVTIGMLSFAIMVPLALTSANSMIKRMGPANWARLHRWVYLAAAAAALHFIMVVKAWPLEPQIYAGIIAALLAARLAMAVHKRMRPVPTRVRGVQRSSS